MAWRALCALGRAYRRHPYIYTWAILVAGLVDVHGYVLAAVVVALPLAVLWWVRHYGRDGGPMALLAHSTARRSTTSIRDIRQLFETRAPHVLPAGSLDALPQPVGYGFHKSGWWVRLSLPPGVVPGDFKPDALAHALAVRRVEVESSEPSYVRLVMYTSDPFEHVEVDTAVPYTLGVYHDGSPMVWDPVTSPHMVVVGQTRSGKSVYLRSVLLSLPRDWEIYIADYKRVEFGNYPVAGMVKAVATSMEDIADMVDGYVSDMHHRLALMAAGDVQHIDDLPGHHPHRLFLFDEVMAAYSAGDTDRDLRKAVDRARTGLMSVALLGGAAGVHSVVSLQQPEAAFFGSSGIRDSYRAVVAMRYLGSSGITMAYPSSDIDVAALFDGQQGHGVAAGLAGDTTPRAFASRYVDAKTTRSAVCK